MKKKSFILLALSLVLAALPIFSYAHEFHGIHVKHNTSKVFMGCNELKMNSYNIDGYNYFKLRDLAMALNGSLKQFDIVWDESTESIKILTNTPYNAVGGELTVKEGEIKDVKPSTASVYMGDYKILAAAYTIDGNNYYKLRDMSRLLNFRLNWDEKNKVILIDPSATGRPS